LAEKSIRKIKAGSAVHGFHADRKPDEVLSATYPCLRWRWTIDTTAPTANPVPSPAPNAAGWNTGDVTVTWGWADKAGGSGIDPANCPASSTSAGEGGAIALSATCADHAGNVGHATATVKVDKTAPTVTYTGNAGTYTVDRTVAITCTASDALSGVATSSCKDIAGPAYTFALGRNSFSATATDKAGNVSAPTSTSFTVTVTAVALDNVIARLVTDPGVAASLQQQVNGIASAPNANAKAGKLGAFINLVNAQTGKSITPANAAILIALAKAL
jgi:hypothetical protein